MTQEEKQLLLQDLCARLPYDVCVHVRYKTGEPCYGKLIPRDIQWFIDSNIENIKPYLHPLSSMTEDEHNDWFQYYHNAETEELNKSGDYFKAAMSGDNAKYDWLNARHFDYRGLIEKGLALEAPEGMYDTKTEQL